MQNPEQHQTTNKTKNYPLSLASSGFNEWKCTTATQAIIKHWYIQFLVYHWFQQLSPIFSKRLGEKNRTEEIFTIYKIKRWLKLKK